MHSSDEDEVERHPINSLIEASRQRQLQKANRASANATPEPQPADEQDDQGAEPEPKAKKKKAKKRKSSKEQDQEVIVIDGEELPIGENLDAGDTQLHVTGMDRPATAPPNLGSAALLTPIVNVELKGNIQLVEDMSEIVQAVELRRLMRAPRYFDDDAGLPETSTKRCFNCGQMGHFAGSCTNAKRAKPCHLCAQFGHEALWCPAILCFRCGRSGHKSAACTNGRVEGWESASQCCNRCGTSSGCPCVGKGDYFRYEGGCTGTYSQEDLKYCRCYVCGKAGHLCCKPTPKVPSFNVSCYNCGKAGHLGESCPDERRAHLAAERMGDASKAMLEREKDLLDRQQTWGTGGRAQYGLPRSQSAGVVRSHQRWGDDDDDDDEPGRSRHGGRDYGRDNGRDSRGNGRDYSAQRYGQGRDNMASAGAYAAVAAMQAPDRRYSAHAPAPQYNAAPQQQYAGQQQYGAAQQQYAGQQQYTVQRYASTGVAQAPVPWNQQQQYGGQQQYGQQQYQDRSRSSGAYESVYNAQQQRYGGGTEYDRSRQGTTQQQQQARRETDNMRSRLDRHDAGGGGGGSHKRSRYTDDDDYQQPSSRQRR